MKFADVAQVVKHMPPFLRSCGQERKDITCRTEGEGLSSLLVKYEIYDSIQSALRSPAVNFAEARQIVSNPLSGMMLLLHLWQRWLACPLLLDTRKFMRHDGRLKPHIISMILENIYNTQRPIDGEKRREPRCNSPPNETCRQPKHVTYMRRWRLLNELYEIHTSSRVSNGDGANGV